MPKKPNLIPNRSTPEPSDETSKRGRQGPEKGTKKSVPWASKYWGVSFLDEPGRAHPRLRWRDRDSGETVYYTLTDEECQSAETKQAAHERIYIEHVRNPDEARKAGGLVDVWATRPVPDLLDQYFGGKDGEGKLVAVRTRLMYRDNCDLLEKWCEKNGIANVRALREPSVLHRFCTWLKQLKKQKPVKGGERGEWGDSDEPLSPATIDQKIRAIKTVLLSLRKTGFLRMPEETITNALQESNEESEKRPFLWPLQIRQLLNACHVHDAQTRVNRDPGRRLIPKYKPILALIQFLIFSGIRIEEISGTGGRPRLLVRHVREHGIEIPKHIAKNGEARTVPYSFSTTLQAWAIQTMQREPDEPLFDFTQGELDSARTRLKRYGAPDFVDYRVPRNTVASYFHCAYGIFGAAASTWSNAILGHTEEVARENYVGLNDKIPQNAKTLEQAYMLEPVLGSSPTSALVVTPANAVLNADVEALKGIVAQQTTMVSQLVAQQAELMKALAAQLEALKAK